MALRAVYPVTSKVVTGVAVLAGDLIIVGSQFGNSLAATTVTDNSGSGTNTYAEVLTGFNYSPSGVSIRLFIAKARENATLQINVNTGNTDSPSTHVHVVGGCSSSLATVLVDAKFSINETVAALIHNSEAVSTTNTNDYAFSMWAQNYQGCTMSEYGTGFTERSEFSSSIYAATYDRTLSAAGSYTHSMQTTDYACVGNILALFKMDAPVDFGAGLAPSGSEFVMQLGVPSIGTNSQLFSATGSYLFTGSALASENDITTDFSTFVFTTPAGQAPVYNATRMFLMF